MNVNPNDTSLFLKRRPRHIRRSSRARTCPSNMLIGSSSSGMEDLSSATASDDDSGRIRSTRIDDDLSHLDISGSDGAHSHRRADSLDMSSSGRSRRMDKQLFLARQSVLPHNNPTWFDKNDEKGPRKSLHAVTEQPAAESSAVEEDTPKFLVFKRTRRPTMRRSSTWY